MDNQIILNQFEELEKKLGNLIIACKAYEKENIDLKKKVERVEEELQDKVTAENNYRQERDLIRSRIDRLIEKFDEMKSE